MKKLFLIFLIFSILPLVSAVTSVSDCAELETAIAANEDILLTANIDCGGVTWGDYAYTKEFDGDGFTISHLKWDGSGETQDRETGMFATCDSSYIHDVGLINVTITSDDYYIGGICGYWDITSAGRMENVYVTGSVTGTGTDGDYVGGIVGYSKYFLSINNSWSNATVSGDAYVGGAIGR
jgi:hypothetical protein